MPPKIKTSLDRIRATSAIPTRVIGDIQRMLLLETKNADRDFSRLHVSEICKSNWCPTSSYYRLTNTAPDKKIEAPYFQLETIWEEGHDSHAKWQRWIDKTGRLRGLWKCLWCEHHWWATSPPNCPKCGMPHEGLFYMEVPMLDETLGLLGHADADVDEGSTDRSTEPLVEIKTVAEGTIRLEQPGLLRQHSHIWVDDEGVDRKFVDLRGIWRDIRRPFPSHLRQGIWYGIMLGRREVVFIYEFKPSQAVKEFVIRVDPRYIEESKDLALDVKWSVSKNRPPTRPSWAASDHTNCKSCVYHGTCWGNPANGVHGEGHHLRAEPADAGSAGRDGKGRADVPSTASGGLPPGARADDGSRRQLPDGYLRQAHSLGGLLERAARPDPDRGTVHRRLRLDP